MVVQHMIAVAALAAAIATPAWAQAPGKLIEAPKYGALKRVLGDLLAVAQADPGCPEPLRLADNLCFADAIAIAKGANLTALPVLGRTADGRNNLYDLRLIEDAFAVEPRADARTGVRVPRPCYALPREGVGYTAISTYDGRTLAQESMLVVCDGPAPPPPWPAQIATIPDIAPQLGRPPVSFADTWPPVSRPLVQGAPQPIAGFDPSCPAAAVLRDGICFDAAIRALEANPALKEVKTFAVKADLRAGARLAATDQYKIKRKRDQIVADKVFFEDTISLAIPEGCVGAAPTEIVMVRGQDAAMYAQAVTEALCGPPPAPKPIAIYEIVGRELPLVGAGPCSPEGRLWGEACFDAAIAAMRAGKERRLLVATATGGARIGAKMSLDERGVGLVEIRADEAFQSFRAETKRTYEAGMRFPQGCRALDNPPRNAPDLEIMSAQRARFVEWVGCEVVK